MKLRLAIAALVLGNRRDSHFAAVGDWLEANLPCRFLADAAAGTVAECGDVEPALVVLLQSRPGQFMEAEIAALRRRWPLARFVAVFSSWCEGEPRSGKILGGVYRVAWHVARERLAADLGALVGNGRSAAHVGPFELPATATADERLLANARPVAARPAVVAVAAVRASVAEPLVDALSAAGHAVVYWPLAGGSLVRGIDAVVWDTFGCDARLAELRDRLPSVRGDGPVVALADFPRPQDVARLAELGVDRVLGKPLLVADLLTCLDELAAPAARVRDRSGAVA